MKATGKSINIQCCGNCRWYKIDPFDGLILCIWPEINKTPKAVRDLFTYNADGVLTYKEDGTDCECFEVREEND